MDETGVKALGETDEDGSDSSCVLDENHRLGVNFESECEG